MTKFSQAFTWQMGEIFNHSYISHQYVFSFRQSPKESLLDRRRLHFWADFRLYYSEFIQELGECTIKHIKTLQNYQRINAEKSVFDTVKGLALEKSQLTPLYFVAARFWVQLFGDSIAVTRS
ncbi:hypothetical protein QUB56_01185 [Microcoleus sp. AR_TQ3_B6]|uniref:hypothetical protein n=1 Tax=Microcoleus sp. AR_TQ3_B6 TaxID=3055284 RepID=UPI002FD2B920